MHLNKYIICCTAYRNSRLLFIEVAPHWHQGKKLIAPHAHQAKVDKMVYVNVFFEISTTTLKMCITNKPIN